jgi:hypothetical protein
MARVVPRKKSEPFVSISREPLEGVSIRASRSHRISNTVLVSVLFLQKTLDLQAIVLFVF